MKKLILLFSLLILSPLSLASEVFSLQERIIAQDLFLSVYPDLYEVDLIHDQNMFQEKIRSLSEENQKTVHNFILKLDSHLPPIFTKAIVTYRFLTPDNTKLSNVILYSFFHKLFILRDAIDNPLTNNPIALQNVLRTVTEVSNLSTNKIVKTLKPVYEEKVKLITAFEDHSAFLDALLSTKLVTFELSSILKGKHQYLVNHTGFISGNKSSFKENSFKIVMDAIGNAKNSLLIDIYFLRGIKGLELGQHLVDMVKLKIKENPQFRTVVHYDFSSDSDLLPVFAYLQDARKKEPILQKSLYLLEANIKLRQSGVPFGLSEKPRMDHSKVLVVDGNSPYAQVLYGSKNWSNYVFRLQGPAAALAQVSYLRDIKAAIANNKEYTLLGNQILDEFKITMDEFPPIGNTKVRLSENDVEGIIRSTRNMLIDMILTAKKNIYIEQFFLYDHFVVDALIKAKIHRPKLDIKILLDSNEALGMNGLPNTLFMNDLIKHKIELRTRIKDLDKRAKVVSIDGNVLHSGSANISPDSLQGSFREFGAQIYSSRMAKGYEKNFLKAWRDPKEVQVLDIKNFKAKIGGRTLSSQTSQLINTIGALLLRSKEDLEKEN